MSDAADDKPETATSYVVGYGKPPVATRFQPGRSGNPRGRPRGKAKASTFGMRPTDELLMDELNRSVTVRENGKVVKMPVLAAAIRGCLQQAAKGSRLHLKLLLDQQRDIEGRHSHLREALVAQALETKLLWQHRKDEHAARGLPPPQAPLPHPDDILVDVRLGTVEIAGPMTDAEQAALEHLLRQRDRLIHDYQTAVAIMGDVPDAKLDEKLQEATADIAAINAELPKRYRRTP